MLQKKLIPTVPKKEVFLTLPYLGTMSSKLKPELRTRFKNSLPHCNIKIILKPTNHLSSLFHFNNVIPKELQSHLIYKFLCSNCNVTYYRKTERHLNIRSSEHIGTSYLIQKGQNVNHLQFQMAFYCITMIAILTRR